MGVCVERTRFCSTAFPARFSPPEIQNPNHIGGTCVRERVFFLHIYVVPHAATNSGRTKYAVQDETMLCRNGSACYSNLFGELSSFAKRRQKKRRSRFPLHEQTPKQAGCKFLTEDAVSTVGLDY